MNPKVKVAFVDVRNTYSPGFGAGYVASAVKNAGYDITLYDTYWMHLRTILRKIVKSDCNVLMVSSMTMLFPDAAKLIRMVKVYRPEIVTLVGGIHAIMIGEKLLDQYPEIDFLCLGEGESMVVEFLNNFGKDSIYEIQNLAYKKDGLLHANSLRKPEDLNALTPYRWDFYSKYDLKQKHGVFHIHATRGCPYNCTYCGNAIYLNRYGKAYLRFKSVEKVIAEMQYLKKNYSPKMFMFDDEMMLFNKEYAKSLFRAMKKEVDIPYGFMARVEYIDEDITAVLKETGCQYIAVGVECGNEEFRRKHLLRFMSNEQIETAFELIHKAEIYVTSFNMIGYPVPNDDQLTIETVELNKKLKPDYTQVTIFFPLPGTRLHQYCLDNNLIDPEKLANANDYYSDSVLRDVSLGKKRRELEIMLNPQGITFKPRRITSSYYWVLRDNLYEAHRFGRSALNFAKMRGQNKFYSLVEVVNKKHS